MDVCVCVCVFRRAIDKSSCIHLSLWQMTEVTQLSNGMVRQAFFFFLEINATSFHSCVCSDHEELRNNSIGGHLIDIFLTTSHFTKRKMYAIIYEVVQNICSVEMTFVCSIIKRLSDGTGKKNQQNDDCLLLRDDN